MEGEIQGKQLIAPRPSTRENGAKERDDGEAGSGAIRDDDGRSKRSEGNGMRRASTKGTASTASSDARGNHVQDDETTPPLSTHHITDDTKQAARSLRQPNTTSHGQEKQAAHARRYDIAPLDDTRSGAGGEARQSDKEGEAINTAVSREKRGRMMNG